MDRVQASAIVGFHVPAALPEGRGACHSSGVDVVTERDALTSWQPLNSAVPQGLSESKSNTYIPVSCLVTQNKPAIYMPLILDMGLFIDR